MFSASTTYEKQLRIEKTRLSHQVWSHGGSTLKKKKDIKRPFFPSCTNWPICIDWFATSSSQLSAAPTPGNTCSCRPPPTATRSASTSTLAPPQQQGADSAPGVRFYVVVVVAVDVVRAGRNNSWCAGSGRSRWLSMSAATRWYLLILWQLWQVLLSLLHFRTKVF